MDDEVWNKYWELLTDISEHGQSIMKGKYWGAAEFAVTAGTDVLDNAIEDGVVRKTKNGKLAIPMEWADAILNDDSEEEYEDDNQTVWEQPAIDESINGDDGIHLKADKTEQFDFMEAGPLSVGGVVPVSEVRDNTPKKDIKKESISESVNNSMGALFGNNNHQQKPQKQPDLTINYDQYGNQIPDQNVVQQPQMNQQGYVQQGYNQPIPQGQYNQPVVQPMNNQPIPPQQPVYPQQSGYIQPQQNMYGQGQVVYGGNPQLNNSQYNASHNENNMQQYTGGQNASHVPAKSGASSTGGVEIGGVNVEEFINEDRKNDTLLKDPDSGFGHKITNSSYGVVSEEEARKLNLKKKMKMIGLLGGGFSLLSLILLFMTKIPTIGFIGGFLGLIMVGVSWFSNRDKKPSVLTIGSAAIAGITLVLALGMSFMAPKEVPTNAKQEATAVNKKE